MSTNQNHDPIQIRRSKNACHQSSGNLVPSWNTQELLKGERTEISRERGQDFGFGAGRYRDLLHFLASRILGDDQAAKRAVNDCLLTVAQNRQQFADEADFRHWLVRVLIDEASLVAYRRSGRFQEALGSACG